LTSNYFRQKPGTGLHSICLINPTNLASNSGLHQMLVANMF
jgi:hypothetical protein